MSDFPISGPMCVGCRVILLMQFPKSAQFFLEHPLVLWLNYSFKGLSILYNATYKMYTSVTSYSIVGVSTNVAHNVNDAPNMASNKLTFSYNISYQRQDSLRRSIAQAPICVIDNILNGLSILLYVHKIHLYRGFYTDFYEHNINALY